MVKEVERLKKNREERRAKQQEILEEKEKAIEMNANHANYDFFCMIQDYQEQLEYNPVTEDDPIIDHQVMGKHLLFTSTDHSRGWRMGTQCLAAPGSPCGPCAPPLH